MGLSLAFDTATHVATVALLADGELLGERTTVARRVLLDAYELLDAAGSNVADVERVIVGTGPGSFTGIRVGLASARGLALALGIPIAGVSTLAALEAGAPGALGVIDAGRREVFARVDGAPQALAAADVVVEPGTLVVGDGARRYRGVFELAGAVVPADTDERHLPQARHLARLATTFAAADDVEPVYVRPPDAKVPA
jgi:tRNA threonylcarbamoyladenosine biosynthesis protein TsaB